MSPKYRDLEQQLTAGFRLERRPVAMAFRDAPLPGVPKLAGTQPSTCSFWRLAANGRTFYTVAADHYNCPVGAYTHNIPLPAERARELDETLGLMASVGYIRMEEVAGIPRLSAAAQVIIYAPLGETPVDPDTVLFSGRAGSIMLLQEAAISAGLTAQLNTLPRPTCMAVPAALSSGAVTSSACIGNRVYTSLDDGDLYFLIDGKHLSKLANQVETIATANATLLEYHQARRQQLASE